MAAAKAKAETPTPEPVDPRAAALAALTGGAAESAPEAEAPEADPGTAAEDFGGDARAVVLFSRYSGKVDGTFKQARKGSVVSVTAAALERGVAIGALRDLGK